jgi:hypothetical protein
MKLDASGAAVSLAAGGKQKTPPTASQNGLTGPWRNARASW